MITPTFNDVSRNSSRLVYEYTDENILRINGLKEDLQKALQDEIARLEEYSDQLEDDMAAANREWEIADSQDPEMDPEGYEQASRKSDEAIAKYAAVQTALQELKEIFSRL